MLRSFIAAALLALFSLLATARGETIVLSPQPVPTSPIVLDEYFMGTGSVAVWGMTESTLASVSSGPYVGHTLIFFGEGSLIPLGQTEVGNPLWRYSVNENEFSGGMRLGALPGAGLGIAMYPEFDGTTYYEVWAQSVGTTTSVSVMTLGMWPLATAVLPSGFYGKIEYAATMPGPLYMMMTPASGSGFTIGAATATVVSVPEPGAMEMVAAFVVLLIALVGWYRAVLWVARWLTGEDR